MVVEPSALMKGIVAPFLLMDEFSCWTRSVTVRSALMFGVMSGFFAARREAILALDLDDVFDGYGDYFIRLLVESLARGSTVLEVPVFYPARVHGESDRHAREDDYVVQRHQ